MNAEDIALIIIALVLAIVLFVFLRAFWWLILILFLAYVIYRLLKS